MENLLIPLKEIKNENKPSIFSIKMNKNIFNNIFLPFLSINDYKEIIKVNKFFYNNIVIKNIKWINYLNDLKINYDLEIPNNKIDFCKESAIKNQRYYKCHFDKSHYIKFLSSGIEHISTFDKENWTWKNDKRYWKLIKSNESLFDEEIASLIEVCWVDVNITMSKIFKGKYKLYIRHGVFNISDDSLILIIKVNDKEIYKEKYPQKYMRDDCKITNKEGNNENNENKDDKQNHQNENVRIIGFNRFMRFPNRIQNKKERGKIANSFLIDINLLNDENKITLKFEHTNNNWKNNWDLDAIILIPEL